MYTGVLPSRNVLGRPQAQAGFVRATQRPTASFSLALTLPVDASLALGASSLQQEPGGGRASADGLSPDTRVFRSATPAIICMTALKQEKALN